LGHASYWTRIKPPLLIILILPKTNKLCSKSRTLFYLHSLYYTPFKFLFTLQVIIIGWLVSWRTLRSYCFSPE
jgi:hypothetical protein